MIDWILSFFTSLRLTVVCLACALVLVFAGTLAQVHLGLYVTQERYFHSLLVYWTPQNTHWKIPVWPGGYLLGGLLLVNLIAAHIKRFSFSGKKTGLFLIHAGLILLFVGQFLTELLQVESFMRIEEGETKNYSESSRKNELALIDVSNPAQDVVTSIPESLLRHNKDVGIPGSPFTVHLKQFYANSNPAGPMESPEGSERIKATQGVGQRLFFKPEPLTFKQDEENVETALVELSSPTGSLGTWTVSNWLTKYGHNLKAMLGPSLGSIADTPQEFSYGGKTYRLAFRPVRYYKPYSLTLLKFTHKIYKGTEIPKDFSSRVRLQNPKTGEDREVLIYMNSPLRYAGETYYQGSFERGDRVSILQVVRNPAWLTPYLSCTMVGVGLLIHFMIHLVNFGRRNSRPPSPSARAKSPVKAEKSAREEKLVSTAAALAAGAQLTNKRRIS